MLDPASQARGLDTGPAVPDATRHSPPPSSLTCC